VAASFLHGAVLVAAVGLTAFVALDWRLYRDCVRWRRIDLLPSIFTMRWLQYLTMVSSALATAARKAIRMRRSRAAA